jgi:cytochrome P450
MADVLVADDHIYEELYDVRREAEEMGNLVEGDIYPGLNGLRDHAPVQKGLLRDLLGLPEHHRHAMAKGRQGYTALSWKACDAAFRDHKTFSSRIMHRSPDEPEKTLGILEMDEPEHLAYRSTLQRMFIRPRAMTWWRQNWIDEIVATLIGSLRGRDRAELNLQLCARVPVHTVTRGIGLQGDDALTFRHALLKSGAPGRVTPQERQAAGQVVDRMLSDLIAKRRGDPQDDVISGLIAAEFDLDGERRTLSDRDILIQAKLVMLAGGGTSWRQMGITLWALLTHRDQYEAVRADRRLIDDAIEEAVRWNPTDPVFSRLVAADAELEGVAIPAGSVLEICLGAANRDPARWDDPDAYDLHRKRQHHLGFGIGTHQCLGKNVAHSEIQAAINGLLDAFPDLRLNPDAPPPFITGGLEQRGMSALPVLLR